MILSHFERRTNKMAASASESCEWMFSEILRKDGYWEKQQSGSTIKTCSAAFPIVRNKQGLK